MKKTLIVDRFGSFIAKKSERVQVKVQGKVVEEVPLIHLEQVLCTGKGIAFSTDFVYACTEKGIPIMFTTPSGKPYASIVSTGLGGTVKTRREQLLAYEDRRGVVLGKAFAVGKLLNQANLLKYVAKYRKRRDKETYRTLRDAAIEIEATAERVKRLEGERIEEIRPQLMNLEGRGAEIYWRTISHVLRADVEWLGRITKGAQDPVNSALNYGYGILYSQVEYALIRAGLDPYAGFVHTDRAGRVSLVYDLVEEFRQTVVDRTIIGLLNKGVEFKVGDDGLLVDKTRRLLADKVLDRLNKGEERYEGKRHKLRTIIQSQARHIATFVRGERPTYKPFVARW